MTTGKLLRRATPCENERTREGAQCTPELPVLADRDGDGQTRVSSRVVENVGEVVNHRGALSTFCSSLFPQPADSNCLFMTTGELSRQATARNVRTLEHDSALKLQPTATCRPRTETERLESPLVDPRGIFIHDTDALTPHGLPWVVDPLRGPDI